MPIFAVVSVYVYLSVELEVGEEDGLPRVKRRRKVWGLVVRLRDGWGS